MPAYALATADASPAFFALDDIARGFIEAAFFCSTDSDAPDEFFTAESQADRADGMKDGTIPNGSDASDLPADEIARVVAFLAPLRERMAAEIAEACERPGYDETRVGHDLYYTIAGHGVGFWDRSELEDTSEEYERLTALIYRHAGLGEEPSDSKWQAAFDARSKLTTVSLGDRMSKLCGRGEISLYADGDADSYVVRFDSLYTSDPAA